MNNPMMRCAVGRSSGKAIMMASSVISGVPPLMMPASADDTCVSPKPNNIHGIETKNKDPMNNGPHDHRGGSDVRVINAMMSKVMPPNMMRPNAIPTGVKDSKATMMNRNEKPQISATVT